MDYLPSLLVYMITFGLSVVCTFGAEWQLKHAGTDISQTVLCYLPKRIAKKMPTIAPQYSRFLFILFSVLAILIPSILGGVRADTVGTDITVYAQKVFNRAVASSDLLEYIEAYYASFRDIEAGYLTLAWLCSRISSNLNSFLFATQLLIVGFFYAAFYAYRKYLSMWMGMSVFLCIFYCTSYNLMRQAVAIAIVMYATSYLLKKKYITYVAFVFLATLFHSTSLIMLGVLVAWLIFGADIKKWVLFALACVTVLVLIFWSDIVAFALNIGAIPSSYGFYVKGTVSFSKMLFLRHLPFIVLEIFAFKKTQEKSKVYSFFFLFAMLTTVGCYVSTVATYAFRIVEYIAIFRVFTLPMLFEAEERPRWKLTYFTCIYLRLVIYFVKIYAMRGSHEVFPYQLFWLT